MLNMNPLTDEQISELAQCLQYHCDKWIAKGGIITSVRFAKTRTGEISKGCSCPFGTIVKDQWDSRYPTGMQVQNALNIPSESAWSFMAGFDGDSEDWSDPNSDPRMFALGRLYRRQYNVGSIN